MCVHAYLCMPSQRCGRRARVQRRGMCLAVVTRHVCVLWPACGMCACRWTSLCEGQACLGYLCVSVCAYMCTHVHLVAARAVQKITIV